MTRICFLFLRLYLVMILEEDQKPEVAWWGDGVLRDAPRFPWWSFYLEPRPELLT